MPLQQGEMSVTDDKYAELLLIITCHHPVILTLFDYASGRASIRFISDFELLTPVPASADLFTG